MRIAGTIIRVIADKGVGFIRRDGGVEYLFYRSAVEGAAFETLRAGQVVAFEEGSGTNGPRADRVIVS